MRGRSAARFVTSATTAAGLPRLDLPEFGFVGRSNVGKSSLIGRLIKRPQLVRTSRTPGRTQLLNLFVFEERLALVDLPGYGYAKRSKVERRQMGAMIADYLEERRELRGVVLVLDARREEPSELDRAIADELLERDVPLLVATTKIDLVPKNKRLHHARRLERALGLPTGAAILLSGKSGEGRDELLAQLEEAARA